MNRFWLFIIFGFLVSCKSFKEPVFISFDGVDSLKWTNGKNIKFNASATIKNPNAYALKVKPCSLDVYIEKRPLGVVYLDEKIKLKRKTESSINAPISIKFNGGAMFTLMRYAKKDSVTVRLEGDIKGGVFIFNKKVPIKIKKTISPKDLKSLGG